MERKKYLHKERLLLIVLGIFPRFGQVITLSDLRLIIIVFSPGPLPPELNPPPPRRLASRRVVLCNPLTFGGKSRGNLSRRRLGTTFGQYKRQSRPRPARPGVPARSGAIPKATPEQLCLRLCLCCCLWLWLWLWLYLVLLPHAAPFCLIIMMLILPTATSSPPLLILCSCPCLPFAAGGQRKLRRGDNSRVSSLQSRFSIKTRQHRRNLC